MPNKDTVIAVISDMQVGGSTALCPPKWQLLDGGTFTASPAQMVMYNKWIESAGNVKNLLTEKRERKRLVVVLNGEPIDGHHHDTPQVITKRHKEQVQMSISLLDEWLQVANYEPDRGDCIYLVRGTDAHEKGEYIEQVGRDLDGVIPYRRDTSPTQKDGRYHFQKLRKTVNGEFFKIQHHGLGRGTRAWTRSNSIAYSLKSEYFTCLDNQQPIPGVIISSHLHVYNYAWYYGKQKTMFGCTTPCWQLKTHFANRVAALEDLNTIGNLYIDVTKSGSFMPYPDILEVMDQPITEF